MNGIKFITNIAIVIALYYLSYHIYNGILNPNPPLGDSWDYHIPIAHTILGGRFLNPQNYLLDQWYYPGSSELLNSFLILFELPLSFSNIISTIILFFVLFKLARVFKLEKYYSILFALSFVTLNGVVRWLNFALVDTWIAIFFSCLIILLKNPQKSISYFFKLGFFAGMFIGTKYTAISFLFPIFIFYFSDLKKNINLKNILVFLIPFSIFGIFWYARNYYYMGNPFWPLSFLDFPSNEVFGGYRVWNVSIKYPIVMIDSFIAELKMWVLVVPFAIVFLINKFIRLKDFKIDDITKLFLIGIICLILFLNFPTSEDAWIMVSSFRYTYPAFIAFFLSAFLIAKKYKREEFLGYFVVANMLFATSLNYYPKLTFIYFPIAILIIFFLNRKKN